MDPKELTPSNNELLDYAIANFRVTLEPSPDQELSISSSELSDTASCTAYLDRLDRAFPACSNTVKASLFAKRYSYLVVASSLYAMTMHNRAADYSIGNCSVESAEQDGNWLPNVRLNDRSMSEPEEGRREQWRETVVANIFAGHLAKVWEVLSKAAPISPAVLWENAAVYVYWLYERRMGEGADERQKQRIRDDFDYLLHEAPAVCFGLRGNPLSRFDSPKCRTVQSEKPVRIRQTCCLYYQASSAGSYCSICPKNYK